MVTLLNDIRIHRFFFQRENLQIKNTMVF